MQPWLPHGHLAPPRLTTMWPISPAEPRPSQLLPPRIRPPPTPVPQKTPRIESRPRPAPRTYSAQVATSTSLPTATLRAEGLREVRAEREALAPVGRFLAFETAPEPASISPGEPTPTPFRALVSVPARRGRLAQRRRHRVGDVLRAALVRGRAPRLTDDVVLLVDDDGLDLGAAEVDARRACVPRLIIGVIGSPDRRVRCRAAGLAPGRRRCRSASSAGRSARRGRARSAAGPGPRARRRRCRAARRAHRGRRSRGSRSRRA